MKFWAEQEEDGIVRIVTGGETGVHALLVEENRVPGVSQRKAVVVENYWEAAGYIMCAKAGVKPSAVRL